MNHVSSIFKKLKSSGRDVMGRLSRNALLRDLSKKALSTVVVILTAIIVGGGALWAIAAFTEPTVSPASSVQDFAKNIMGADNADNAFSSSSVVANQDGSLIERVEYLQTRPIYLGRTASSYTGNLGGIAGANAKCQVNYAGSHMCKQSEMLASGATSFGGYGWIACDSLQGHNDTSNVYYIECAGVSGIDSVDATYSASCSNWTYTSANSNWHGPMADSSGSFTYDGCNISRQIHCCK